LRVIAVKGPCHFSKYHFSTKGDFMKTRLLTLRRGLALAAPFVLLSAIAISAQMDQQFAQAQQHNVLALRKYEWKSRTEIQKDGETKKVQLALVRYDSDGNLQKTVISSTPEPDIPKFGIRRAVAKKKIGDFRDTLAELEALAKSYSELPPDRMQRFMATATITPELTAQQKLVRIAGRAVLQSGDSMTVFVDASSRKQRRIEIQTWLDQKPVRIVSEFQDLAQGGPTYVARSSMSYDGNSIGIITENFDYARVAR
jgi:hypothetical protein